MIKIIGLVSGSHEPGTSIRDILDSYGLSPSEVTVTVNRIPLDSFSEGIDFIPPDESIVSISPLSLKGG